MRNLLPFVPVGLGIILLFNMLLLYNIITLVPVASASLNASQGNATKNIGSQNNTQEILNAIAASRAGNEAAKTNAEIAVMKSEQQQSAFSIIVGTSIVALAIIVVVPLLLSMYFTYRKELNMISKGTNVRPIVAHQLYRVLVAIGVIFTVILVVVYLNSLIWFNIGAVPTIVNSLLETQKSFLTIIGTAFASLVAFYFGTRGTQGSNVERTTAVTRHELGQKALEVIDVNPINGSVGIDIDSQVTATFDAPVRSSTISDNTFSVKDDNGNPVQGRITLTDNNTTIVFTPVPTFNRNSRYTVTIKGIMDISGASMATDTEWHFTTAV